MALRINVQVDRLPDLRNGDVQVGMRLSAAFESGGTPQTESLADLLPWKWTKCAGGADAWTPHDAAAWSIWRIDGANPPVLIEEKDLQFIPAPDALDVNMRRAVEAGAERISRTGHETMRVPDPSAEAHGAHVTGHVESLTQLPAPLPAQLAVWTCATIPSALLGDEPINARFIATPRFVAGASRCCVVLAPPRPQSNSSANGDYETTLGASEQDLTLVARVDIVASLSASALSVSPGQLIDPANLTIRQSTGQQFERSDWSGSLAREIGNILDPGLHCLAVLDGVVRDWVDGDAGKRAAIETSLEPAIAVPDALRRALTLVYTPVLWPLFRASPASLAAGEELLVAAAADAKADLWARIFPWALRRMQEESALRNFGAGQRAGMEAIMRKWNDALLVGADVRDPCNVRVVSRARLLASAGVLVTPAKEQVFIEESAESLLENPESLRSLLAGFLVPRTVTPTPADSTAAITLSRWRRTADVAHPHEQIFSIESPIDLNALKAQRLTLKLRVENAAADAQLRLCDDAGNELYATAVKNGDGTLELWADDPADTSAQRTFHVSGTLVPADKTFLWDPGQGRIRLELDAKFTVLCEPEGDEAQREILRAELRADLLRALAEVDMAVLRDRCTLTHATAYLPVLLRPDPAEGAPFAERLKGELKKFVTAYFGDVFNAARHVGLQGIDAASGLHTLLDKIRDAAIEHASSDVAQLTIAPRSVDAGQVTQMAQPLVFAIDQLEDFDDAEDLWTRLSGVGVLLGRSNDGSEPGAWWSLNVATIHTPARGAAGRENLSESNAVHVHGGADWHDYARVDPVPLVVTESDGIRTALVRYDCQSIVAEMEGARSLQADFDGALRRPEAFLFPRKSSNILFPRLPPLTAGRYYFVLPYLIGHGGALPRWLRETESNPIQRKSYGAPGQGQRFTGHIALDASEISAFVRKARYLRTVPVGAPRIARSAVLPELPAGVDPLAAELPIRSACVTLLGDKNASAYFLDASRTRGVIDVKREDNAGLRVDIGLLRRHSAQPSKITVALCGDDGKQQWAAVSLGAWGGDGSGLRVEYRPGEGLNVYSLRTAPGAYFEDEPQLQSILDATIGEPRPADWRPTWIKVSLEGGAVDLEPPRIAHGSWVTKGGSAEFMPDSDQFVLPPEATHTSRSIHLLDGILPSIVGARPAVSVDLRRPAVDFATFDRWINGPLSEGEQYGNAQRKEVSELLNAADKLTRVPDDKIDRSLDDPAVECIFVQAVQIFPWVSAEADPVPISAVRGFSGDIAQYTGQNPMVQRFDIRVDFPKLDSCKPPFGEPRIEGKTLYVTAGCVYELRFYAAIPIEQPRLAPHDVAERCDPAITQSWRLFKEMWLGPPLVLTIEVATQLMPDLYGKQQLVFELQRPPASHDDHALVRMRPPAADQGFLYRYASGAALISQRWSWRGRPQPQPGTFEHDGEWAPAATDQDLVTYFDASFMGRNIDDVGSLVERRLTRAHVYAGRRSLSELPPKIPDYMREDAVRAKEIRDFADRVPQLFDKDLEYRTGAHLRRFSLRLKSRYAALRPNDSRMVTFGHHSNNKSKVEWQSLLIRDRDSGRKPQRPGLALVLPLTEPLAETGVPPILAIFNETMHAQFHAGDGIESSVEMARHPFIENELIARLHQMMQECRDALDLLDQAQEEGRPEEELAKLAEQLAIPARICGTLLMNFRGEGLSSEGRDCCLLAVSPGTGWLDPGTREGIVGRLGKIVDPISPPAADSRGTIKYWPEYSLDVVRSGAAHDGTPVPIRLDGPFGYTFDEGVEAGRFDHAGCTVSVPDPRLADWSLIKLRFRRLEAPELFWKKPKLLPLGAETGVRLAHDGSSETPRASAGANVFFETQHEAVILELEKVQDTAAKIRLRWRNQGKSSSSQFVEIEACVIGHTVSLIVSTELGKTSKWTADCVGAQVSVRVVISERAPPKDADEFAPAADVSVRVYLRDETDDRAIDSLLRNSWLSIITLPLIANDIKLARGEPLCLGVLSDANGNVWPARATEFSPGVWCQFTTDLSMIDVLGPTPGPKRVKDLRCTFIPGAKESELQFRVEATQPLVRLRAPNAPDADSDLEEILYAVVTRYVYDAFEHKTELPFAVFELAAADKADSATRVWESGDSSKFVSGRVRLMRALRGKLFVPGNRSGFEFEDDPRDRFERLFVREDRPRLEMEMNPLDAGGVVLGVSPPMECTI